MNPKDIAILGVATLVVIILLSLLVALILEKLAQMGQDRRLKLRSFEQDQARLDQRHKIVQLEERLNSMKTSATLAKDLTGALENFARVQRECGLGNAQAIIEEIRSSRGSQDSDSPPASVASTQVPYKPKRAPKRGVMQKMAKYLDKKFLGYQRPLSEVRDSSIEPYHNPSTKSLG